MAGARYRTPRAVRAHAPCPRTVFRVWSRALRSSFVSRFLISPRPAVRGWAPHVTRRPIGSGAGDCAPAPSHTTGRAVFRIRRLNAAALYVVAARSDGITNPWRPKTALLRAVCRPSGSRTSLSVERPAGSGGLRSLGLMAASPLRPRSPVQGRDRSCRAPLFQSSWSPSSRFALSSALSFFGPWLRQAFARPLRTYGLG